MTTPMTTPVRPGSPEQLLLSFLGRGEARARRQATLEKLCGWQRATGDPDTRKVQKVLRSLRKRHGIVWASSCREPMGTYIIDDPRELEAYKRQLFSRARETIDTIRRTDEGWRAELYDELFGSCKNCGATIDKERDYCGDSCRNEFHSRARTAGYAALGVA